MPDSVLVQETLGMIYRDSRPLTVGSEAWAAKAFKRALELEPTNPALAGELAKAYLNNNDWLQAEKYFIKALELKNDYYDAEYGLARVYLAGKKDNQALGILTKLEAVGSGAEIFYELGRLYFNRGEMEKAVDKFRSALAVSPGHEGSLYGLAKAYEARGDNKEALKYYLQILEMNTGNVEAEKKVKELSK